MTRTRTLSAVFNARPERLVRITERFDVWQATGPLHSAEPLLRSNEREFTDLETAVEFGVMKTAHKEMFFVRRINDFEGKATLHFYIVRQRSKPVRIRPTGMAHTVQHRPLYEEHLFDVAMVEGLVPA